MHRIEVVGESDLVDLLPMLRAYCEFYEVDPSDDRLLAMCRALAAAPDTDGVQLIARDDGGRAAGFATVFWTWQTLDAARVGVLNDLWVQTEDRGSGLAEALIEGAATTARHHRAVSLVWQTALDNHRAQAVYDRIGARRSEWLDYELSLAEVRP